MKRDSKQILSELLVLKAKAGSDKAFRDLYDLWSNDLLRLAWHSIGERSGAEEVSQDSWIAISKKINTIKDPASFPAWAFSITNRKSIDWIRKRARERNKLNVFKTQQEDQPNSEPRLDERKGNLGEAILRLSSDEQKLIHLFYETMLSIREISQVLEIPPGTVKSRLFKVREKLRIYLERKNHE